jgi:MSHA type pilus biogenesis protein MshL
MPATSDKKWYSTILIAATAVFAGCAAPASQVHTSVRVEPTVAPVTTSTTSTTAQPAPPGQPVGTIEPAAPPTLPQISAGPGPALAAAPERRLREVNIPAGTPISQAVASIGSQYGLTVTVDPDVRGTAQANLRNVTLDEALTQIVTNNGARYQLQGSVLRVVAVRMETRTFPLDYVALSRIGSMSTVVQRRLSGASTVSSGSSTGLSVNAGAAGIGGGDVLQATSAADVWQDIRVALTGIMQAGVSNANGATTANGNAGPASQASAGLNSGPQTSSITFGDGSTLIINPMAGLITVIAFPDKIAAVERYIGDFQASVLRQVKIEAKIVEVRMDRSAQFGIDWSAVASTASGRYGVALRNDPSTTTTGNAGTVNFTFTGGNTTINAVLTALESQGDVQVLNNENAMVLNNQRAIFQVTDDQIFFSVTRSPQLGPTGAVVGFQSTVNPQQISVGVVLDVLPQISADNILTMDIRPAVTNITSVATISLPDGTSTSAPNIARREGDTVARMRAGETTMIGGLVQSRNETTRSGIPVLKDIPLLGRLFTNTKQEVVRSELVVFLTPTIITGQPGAGR